MNLYLFAFEFGLIGGRYHNNSTTGNNHSGSVRDLSLAVSGDARVITDVLVSDVRDPQLGAVVEDAYARNKETN